MLDEGESQNVDSLHNFASQIVRIALPGAKSKDLGALPQTLLLAAGSAGQGVHPSQQTGAWSLRPASNTARRFAVSRAGV